MVTKEQLIAGLILFLKKELLPMLPDSIRMFAGAVLLHNSLKANDLLLTLSESKWGPALGIVTADGNVDVDVWGQELKTAMQEFCAGKITLTLPMAKPIYVSPADIDTLKRYIKGEIN